MISPAIYRGWVVLGISILTFMSSAGIEASWGTMILCFQQDKYFPESSLAQLGIPFTVYSVFKISLSNFVFMILSGAGKLSLRQFIAVGVSLRVLGLVLASFANGPHSVAIAFGILYGTGDGLCCISTYSFIALWFPWTHRFHVFSATALNVMEPLGGSIFNNVNAKICESTLLGWRWAFRVYAVTFGFVGFLLLLVFGDPPMTSSDEPDKGTNKDPSLLQKPPWSACAKVGIHGIWAMAVICKGFGYTLPFVILPKHTTDLGYTEDEAGYVMAVFGIMGMVSEALTSCVGDFLKGNLLVVNLVAAAVLIVNNISAPYSTSLTAIFVYGAVSGFSVGCMVYFSVNYEIMDGENVATLFMTMRFSKGIGAAVGPYLAGRIRFSK
ncbi:monocarboxylate transporter 13-like [Lingula anatina]|uniref:Monocarboxylate transporter 13-like n=1 Tax=Lingula anatina TaxID=7574 RepID=A0A1S3JZ28_LINAN|nr:monocarboxylate transporter 13-like [Lingula anatina]|eukprot:XP_013415660.1 monocarboxylate transporter 13-like [Lingula anatina]